MLYTLKLFGILLPVFLVVDLLWLGVVMKNFYDVEMGDLARREGGALAPRWGAAILIYLLIPAGIVLFVRPYLSPDQSYWTALTYGALFGLVVYGVYDLTNYSLIEKWSLRMTIADILWGCTICGTMSAFLQWIMRWL